MMYARWTEAQDNKLVRLAVNGVPPGMIADIMGRTPGAIRARLLLVAAYRATLTSGRWEAALALLRRGSGDQKV